MKTSLAAALALVAVTTPACLTDTNEEEASQSAASAQSTQWEIIRETARAAEADYQAGKRCTTDACRRQHAAAVRGKYLPLARAAWLANSAAGRWLRRYLLDPRAEGVASASVRDERGLWDEILDAETSPYVEKHLRRTAEALAAQFTASRIGARNGVWKPYQVQRYCPTPAELGDRDTGYAGRLAPCVLVAGGSASFALGRFTMEVTRVMARNRNASAVWHSDTHELALQLSIRDRYDWVSEAEGGNDWHRQLEWLSRVGAAEEFDIAGGTETMSVVVHLECRGAKACTVLSVDGLQRAEPGPECGVRNGAPVAGFETCSTLPEQTRATGPVKAWEGGLVQDFVGDPNEGAAGDGALALGPGEPRAQWVYGYFLTEWRKNTRACGFPEGPQQRVRMRLNGRDYAGYQQEFTRGFMRWYDAPPSGTPQLTGCAATPK